MPTQPPSSFARTVAVLARAHASGTLHRGSCAACACGQIIAAANHLTVVPASPASGLGKGRFMWAELESYVAKSKGYRDPHSLWDGATTFPNPEALLANTGYTPAELGRIEETFMGWGDHHDSEDAGFGMLAAVRRVVRLLGQMHEVDEAEVARALRKFQKQPILAD